MPGIADHLQRIAEELQAELATVCALCDIERIRIRYLGRKEGTITDLLRSIKNFSPQEKQEFAPLIQKLHQAAETMIAERSSSIEAQAAQKKTATIDVTAYRNPRTVGGLHPLTQLIERIQGIFMSLGYSIVSGPEVEDEWHNFDALNIPASHPARDLHDTFWLNHPGLLLRTHTSTVQIRELEQSSPPIAICAPGRVFRHEATDATHDFTFTQCEGLFIDRTVSVAHLLGTIEQFMQLLFCNKHITIRVRPSYYPFVEPGLDVDIRCPFCEHGCSICKKSMWIEIGGAGLVHPHVLRSCNLNPDEWSGFAFGFGIERIAMMLYGIDDVRLFKTSKYSILQQFSGSPSGAQPHQERSLS